MKFNADSHTHQPPLYYYHHHHPIPIPGCVESKGYQVGRYEMRESILREMEKERIREEIIAEEMARKRMLEAEVRNDLMMERQMAVRRGGGVFTPMFMWSGHENVLEMNGLRRERIGRVMSVDEKGGGGGGCEMRGFQVSSVKLLGDSPVVTPLLKDRKKEVVDLSEPHGETQSGTKRKSATQVSEGSSQHDSVRSKKKVKEEWSCAVCQVSATSERGLNEHLQGKKHYAKEAALVAQKTGAEFGLGVAPKNLIVKQVKLALTTVNPTPETSKPLSTSGPNDTKTKDDIVGENKRDKFKFWCEMCQVGAFTEKVMNAHKEGKKHSTRLVGLYRKGKADSEASATKNTCETKDKTETATNQTVIIETVATEVTPEVKQDDVEYLAEGVGEETVQ